ncbi:hypothetical protein [Sphingobium sp. DC-2]|uniref:hypothetical protein n=1 Tax=Sphingobium sp. DC-2 TaxID=1303256 RepID=UPI0004C43F8B|nr:hypothetical protein [Sphingobium sp. DC-2]
MNNSPSQRLHDRERRLLKGQMRHPRLGLIDILIRDVSERGIGGKCTSDIAAGDRVTIHLTGYPPVDGTIAWRNGQGFGVQLDAPVDPAAVKSPPQPETPVTSHEVPRPFRPTVSTRRPGFDRRRTGPKTGSDWT